MEQKTDYKWTIWLILSLIWLFINFLVTICLKPSNMYTIGQNTWFVTQYSISLINISVCVYIGAK